MNIYYSSEYRALQNTSIDIPIENGYTINKYKPIIVLECYETFEPLVQANLKFVKQKYKSLFMKSLSIEPAKFNENLKYNEIDEWDSIGHMSLVAAIEEEYKISLETDDIIDLKIFNC